MGASRDGGQVRMSGPLLVTLHLVPGLVFGGVFFVLSWMFIGSGLTGYLALLVTIPACLVPFELGVMRFWSARETGKARTEVQNGRGTNTGMAEPLTREAFQRSRAAAALAARRDGRIVAAFSVVFGVTQLVFLRWAEAQLERGFVLAIALPGFIIYITVVGILLWRMERRKRSLGPICPQCGIRLMGLSERVAAATGRCDSCGGAVVDQERADRQKVSRPKTGSRSG
jgi:hypothetical protein